MSDIKKYLEDCRKAWPDMELIKFMLDHGREYRHGPTSFDGPRGTPKECFSNATWLAMQSLDLTYVEGKVAVHGIPIDHAWCVTADGFVIDPTLAVVAPDTGMERVGGYFGVSFRRDYVIRAALVNNACGLLDGYHSRKTLPKLIELGLDEGQRWLLDAKVKRNSKLAAAVMLAALLLLPHNADAQQRTIYGADGRVIAREAVSPNGSTTVYGADGRVQGRTTTSPSSGTTTVYGSDGRKIGTIQQKGK